MWLVCSFLDKAAILTQQDAESGQDLDPWKLCTLTEVEELKVIIRLLPIWATTILFYTAYAQQQTLSVEQGTTMDRRLGSIRIPAATMGAFLQAAIIVTVATYDKYFIPLVSQHHQLVVHGKTPSAFVNLSPHATLDKASSLTYGKNAGFVDTHAW